MEKFFLHTTDGKQYFVTTNNLYYVILLDEQKGIGIYQEIDNKLLLIKQYHNKNNLKLAINYLLKKEMIIK